MKSKFIAVEGPIGVGKTSLVDLLASRFDAVKILERTENPFLEEFYRDRPGAAFQAQLFFLLNRYQQQKELSQGNLFNQVTLSDYVFAKDKIFAYLNLDDSELMIYEKLYALLEPNIPRPDLVIYLQASDRILMERIRRRSRDYELGISEKYIAELNRAYNYFFFHYTSTPLLVIDTSDIDFVQRIDDLNELVSQIEQMEKGVQYYIPLGAAEGPRRERS
ncbi:MAG TPA: deoxynucleoside kinase [Candidatus Polarisedimenticolia bacterium]|jgi:deoxyadenosine/deoxycytidine kinase|nr:deoxynucleoside kinase [Candidatus Polarisedimenticolia bacterium]